MVDLTEPDEQPDQSTQNLPQVPEDHADVVTAAAEDGKDCVAIGSLERTSRQSAVVFHVADHRFYGAAPS